MEGDHARVPVAGNAGEGNSTIDGVASESKKRRHVISVFEQENKLTGNGSVEGIKGKNIKAGSFKNPSPFTSMLFSSRDR